MGGRRFYALVGWTALLVALALNAANLYWGELNQDEGWYLYAAGLVAQGQIPYADFAYPQGPVLPFVYAWIHPFVAGGGGMAAGRLFTTLLGLGSALCAAWLAQRAAGREAGRFAGLLAFALVAVNVYQSYFTTVVKTYGLSAILLAGGALLLTFPEGWRGKVAVLASSAALVLAAGTRISAGAALPAALAWLWWVRRERPGQWIWFAGGTAVFAVLLVVPFLVICREGFLFGLFQYHGSRDAGGILPWLVYRGAFLSRVVQAYFVACVLLVGLGGLFLLRRRAPDVACCAGGEAGDRPFPGAARFLWITVGGITLLHFLAPVPYDDYEAMIYPLFGAALGLAAARVAGNEESRRVLLGTVLLASVAAAFSSPINQSWFNRGRDRIWWRLKEQSDLRSLQEAALLVRGLAGPEGEVLTQDTYLAVEAGLRVPHGLELGPFSYYPDWEEARATRLHVLSRAGLEDLLRHSRARVAAFSGYGLAIMAPQVRPIAGEERTRLFRILGERYRAEWSIPAFGQGGTDLEIYRRRAEKE